MRAVPPIITIACTVEWCQAAGRPARVHLRLVALGVVEMPRWVCVYCGCELVRTDVEEDPVAKITVHGGPTDARANPPTAVPPPAEPVPVVAETPADAEPVPDVPAEQAEAAPEETEPAAEVPAEPPAPKRRGRPRKAA